MIVYTFYDDQIKINQSFFVQEFLGDPEPPFGASPLSETSCFMKLHTLQISASYTLENVCQMNLDIFPNGSKFK